MASPTPGCGNSLVVVCLCFLTWHRVGPLRSFYPLVLLSCFCSLQFHLSTTFLCSRFIARGSRMSTSIDEFRDYPGSNPFVSNIPMCLLHCSWLSHLYLYWFSRSEIIQLYSICKPHSYVLASLLMALASQLLLISKKRDRSVLFHL